MAGSWFGSPASVSGGSGENATVATAVLSDLLERGLDPEQGILFVIDCAKVLRRAMSTLFRGAGAAPPACPKRSASSGA